jgi:glycosyltransferase involved in cell wall biosynthesis
MAVVSSGFHKTHMTTAARAVAEHGLLTLAITAAYPTARVEQALRAFRLSDKGRFARLLERGEGIPEDRLRTVVVPELLYDLAVFAARAPVIGRLSGRLAAGAMRLHARRAARLVRRLGQGGGIYHYRAGFGHSSVDAARRLGMKIVCDHAIAHPLVLNGLIQHRGRSDSPVETAAELTPLERAIFSDIERADVLLVNSHFVQETCERVGWPADRTPVIYLGVDDNFLNHVPARPVRAMDGPLRLLFAGRFERRKGAEVLVEALEMLSDIAWEVRLAGPITDEIRASVGTFLEDPRVYRLGPLRRPELAHEMGRADVFVFPSYAEGSARVVFEALACGCYVITTPNSGTIVEDGVHGAIVAPDDPHRLAATIREAAADRGRVAEIGSANAKLVRERYNQVAYGDALATLYRRLLTIRPESSDDHDAPGSDPPIVTLERL